MSVLLRTGDTLWSDRHTQCLHRLYTEVPLTLRLCELTWSEKIQWLIGHVLEEGMCLSVLP